MQPSPAFVRLVIALPASDYNAYVLAGRQLLRVMGPQAPKVLALIAHTLRCRDARGLVEDYLESVNWPVKLRKPVNGSLGAGKAATGGRLKRGAGLPCRAIESTRN